jgi:hypothetical protein
VPANARHVQAKVLVSVVILTLHILTVICIHVLHLVHRVTFTTSVLFVNPAHLVVPPASLLQQTANLVLLFLFSLRLRAPALTLVP